MHLKRLFLGLPWWRSGWESACQCRGRGFEPWSGKIPHAVEQLGPWATTAEPARLEPVLRNKRGRDGERPVHRDEEWSPLAATRESPRTETKTQHSHKQINKRTWISKKKKRLFLGSVLVSFCWVTNHLEIYQLKITTVFSHDFVDQAFEKGPGKRLSYVISYVIVVQSLARVAVTKGSTVLDICSGWEFRWGCLSINLTL